MSTNATAWSHKGFTRLISEPGEINLTQRIREKKASLLKILVKDLTSQAQVTIFQSQIPNPSAGAHLVSAPAVYVASSEALKSWTTADEGFTLLLPPVLRYHLFYFNGEQQSAQENHQGTIRSSSSSYSSDRCLSRFIRWHYFNRFFVFQFGIFLLFRFFF